MSRSMHGLHKALGGVRKRNREALASLDGKVCALRRCDDPAAGYVVNAFNGIGPACATHLEDAESRGYGVLRPRDEL